MSLRFAWSFVVGLSVLSLVGCARAVVSMPVWRPADANVDGIQRLAVLEFIGPELLADEARQTLLEELTASQFYQVLPAEELDRLAPPKQLYLTEKPPPKESLDRGRRAGVDAILVGQVERQRGREFDAGRASVSVGEQELIVRVKVELIDVRSGQVRARHEGLRKHVGETSSSKSQRRRDPSSEILLRLTRESALATVPLLTARQESTRVELANQRIGGGASDVRSGIAAARDGNWPCAKAHWEIALHDNPENHAALYNLGLAHEASGDFSRASELYTAARDLAETKLYERASFRLNRNAADYQTAMGQINRTQLLPTPLLVAERATRLPPTEPYAAYPPAVIPTSGAMPPAPATFYR